MGCVYNVNVFHRQDDLVLQVYGWIQTPLFCPFICVSHCAVLPQTLNMPLLTVAIIYFILKLKNPFKSFLLLVSLLLREASQKWKITRHINGKVIIETISVFQLISSFPPFASSFASLFKFYKMKTRYQKKECWHGMAANQSAKLNWLIPQFGTGESSTMTFH